jgi:hypothetical protein
MTLLRNRLLQRTIQLTVACGSLACGPDSSAEENATHPIAGTYEFRLCRVRCGGRDEPTSLATGRLVLSDSAIDTAAHIHSDSARGYLNLQDIWEAGDGPANGCFVWDERRRSPPSYGMSRAGALVHWSATGDSLFFLLYRSPDAEHSVSAVRTSAGFEGRGVSSGAGAAEVDWPADIVVARWMAAPDFSICSEAADSALAQFRDFIRNRPWLPNRLQN